MKRKSVVKIGARRIGVKKQEALGAREQNQQHKANFKAGPVAKLTRYPTGSIPPHEFNTPLAKKGKK